MEDFVVFAEFEYLNHRQPKKLPRLMRLKSQKKNETNHFASTKNQYLKPK